MIRLSIAALALAGTLAAQPKGVLRAPRARVNQMEKFSSMTPQERRRAIERLPPERQKQIERNVERYNSLSGDEKERLRHRFERFQNLSPEDQRRTRQLSREVNDMPEDRRQQVRRETARLRRMKEDKRKQRLASDQFKSQYSPEEQRVIEGLAAIPIE